jgi:predicted Zn-ribbon and HTH transcriptional regulator
MAPSFFKADFGLVGRAPSPTMPFYYDSRPIVLPRTDTVPLPELYYLATHCNPVYKALQTIRDYLMKEGYKWVKRYSAKCVDCGFEHPTSHEPQKCESCGSTALHEPDEKRMRDVDEFFQSCDYNDNQFIEIMKMFEWHLDITNTAYLVVAKEYKEFDEKGNPKLWRNRDLFVPHPMTFHKVIDTRTQRPGGKWWICIGKNPVTGEPCRPGDNIDKDGNEVRKGRVYTKPGRCEDCAGKLFEVWYVAGKAPLGIGTTSVADENISQYYLGPIRLEDGTVLREVISTNKYLISYDYGDSPMVAIYKLAITLLSMENYNYTFYHEERAPRILLSVQTNNPEGIKNVWDSVQDKNVGQGNHHIPLITHDPGNSGANRPMQVLEISKTPQELGMLDVNKWFYTCIASAFGVTPLFLGINTNSGMQSQGPTQWQVQTLTAEIGQNVFNNKVFPQLLEQFGLHKDGWKLILVRPEEKIDAQQVELRLQKMEEAIGLQSLGFEVLSRDHNGDYKFGTRPVAPPMGGMGGQQQPGGANGGNVPMGQVAPPALTGADDSMPNMADPGKTPSGPGADGFKVGRVE